MHSGAVHRARARWLPPMTMGENALVKRQGEREWEVTETRKD